MVSATPSSGPISTKFSGLVKTQGLLNRSEFQGDRPTGKKVIAEKLNFYYSLEIASEPYIRLRLSTGRSEQSTPRIFSKCNPPHIYHLECNRHSFTPIARFVSEFPQADVQIFSRSSKAGTRYSNLRLSTGFPRSSRAGTRYFNLRLPTGRSKQSTPLIFSKSEIFQGVVETGLAPLICECTNISKE